MRLNVLDHPQDMWMNAKLNEGIQKGEREKKRGKEEAGQVGKMGIPRSFAHVAASRRGIMVRPGRSAQQKSLFGICRIDPRGRSDSLALWHSGTGTPSLPDFLPHAFGRCDRRIASSF